MPSSKQAIINLLEGERKKFENEDYAPPPRLLSRCRSSCLLLKSDTESLATKPRQTRERLSNARHNLQLILEKSAELFILRILSESVTKIGLKREYGLVPPLLAWWKLVPHPPALKHVTRDICAEFGLQYPAPEKHTGHASESVNTISQDGNRLGAERRYPYHDTTQTEEDKEPLPRAVHEPSLHASMYDRARGTHPARLPGQASSKLTHLRAVTTGSQTQTRISYV